jgi:sugar phosphate isomerase/epimerase
MGKDRDLATMIDICRESGMAGFEIFEHPDYRSRVSLESTPAERAKVKGMFEGAGLPIAALAITCRYDVPDQAKVRASIEETKRYVDLAKDIGAPRLRCLGDCFREGLTREQTMTQVSAALREICEYADPLGIDCPVEMHGDFSAWEVALDAVQRVDHPRCYLVHNGAPRNMQPGDWDEIWAKIGPHVKHVHVHDIISDRFPSKRLFLTLRDSGYDGFISLELQPSDDPVRVLKLTKALVDEWLSG